VAAAAATWLQGAETSMTAECNFWRGAKKGRQTSVHPGDMSKGL